MSNIYRYKFQEFITTDIADREMYYSLFKHLTPKESLTDSARQIHTLPFIDVRAFMDYFTGKREVTGEAIAWMVSLVSGCKEAYVYNSDTFEVFSVLNHIKAQVEKLIANENARLTGGLADPRAEAAGVEVFNQFGIYNELEKLSGGDVLKWEACMQLPYYLAFKKLHYEHEMAQFQHRYAQVKI